jgi:hypothetical protein
MAVSLIARAACNLEGVCIEMSRLWLNIRFWYWHLQIGPDWPWVTWRRNDYYDLVKARTGRLPSKIEWY